jgi:hypothetical protein
LELERKESQLKDLQSRITTLRQSSEAPLTEAEKSLEICQIKLSMQQNLCLWTLRSATSNTAEIAFERFSIQICLQENHNRDGITAHLRLSGDADDYVHRLVASRDGGSWPLFEIANLLNALEQHQDDVLQMGNSNM